MKIVARGWTRDHGPKRVSEGGLERFVFMDTVKTYDRNKIYVQQIPSYHDGGIEISTFAGDLRLGGDYLIEVSLTDEELFEIFKLRFQNKTLAQMATMLGKK